MRFWMNRPNPQLLAEITSLREALANARQDAEKLKDERNAYNEQLRKAIDTQQQLQEVMADHKSVNHELLVEKSKLQEELIGNLKLLKEREERLANLRIELADSEFEVEQLRIAFRCASDYSLQLESDKRATDTVVEQFCAGISNVVESAAAVTEAAANAAAAAAAAAFTVVPEGSGLCSPGPSITDSDMSDEAVMSDSPQRGAATTEEVAAAGVTEACDPLCDPLCKPLRSLATWQLARELPARTCEEAQNKQPSKQWLHPDRLQEQERQEGSACAMLGSSDRKPCEQNCAQLCSDGSRVRPRQPADQPLDLSLDDNGRLHDGGKARGFSAEPASSTPGPCPQGHDPGQAEEGPAPGTTRQGRKRGRKPVITGYHHHRTAMGDSVQQATAAVCRLEAVAARLKAACVGLQKLVEGPSLTPSGSLTQGCSVAGVLTASPTAGSPVATARAGEGAGDMAAQARVAAAGAAAAAAALAGMAGTLQRLGAPAVADACGGRLRCGGGPAGSPSWAPPTPPQAAMTPQILQHFAYLAADRPRRTGDETSHGVLQRRELTDRCLSRSDRSGTAEHRAWPQLSVHIEDVWRSTLPSVPRALPASSPGSAMPPTPTPQGLGLDVGQLKTLQGWGSAASDDTVRTAVVVQGRNMAAATPPSPASLRSSPTRGGSCMQLAGAPGGRTGSGTEGCSGQAGSSPADSPMAAAGAAATANQAAGPDPRPTIGTDAARPTAAEEDPELVSLRLTNEALQRQVAELQRQNDLLQLRQLATSSGQPGGPPGGPGCGLFGAPALWGTAGCAASGAAAACTAGGTAAAGGSACNGHRPGGLPPAAAAAAAAAASSTASFPLAATYYYGSLPPGRQQGTEPLYSGPHVAVSGGSTRACSSGTAGGASGNGLGALGPHLSQAASVAAVPAAVRALDRDKPANGGGPLASVFGGAGGAAGGGGGSEGRERPSAARQLLPLPPVSGPTPMRGPVAVPLARPCVEARKGASGAAGASVGGPPEGWSMPAKPPAAEAPAAVENMLAASPLQLPLPLPPTDPLPTATALAADAPLAAALAAPPPGVDAALWELELLVACSKGGSLMS